VGILRRECTGGVANRVRTLSGVVRMERCSRVDGDPHGRGWLRGDATVWRRGQRIVIRSPRRHKRRACAPFSSRHCVAGASNIVSSVNGFTRAGAGPQWNRTIGRPGIAQPRDHATTSSKPFHPHRGAAFPPGNPPPAYPVNSMYPLSTDRGRSRALGGATREAEEEGLAGALTRSEVRCT
jgi:hypothetical protein